MRMRSLIVPLFLLTAGLAAPEMTFASAPAGDVSQDAATRGTVNVNHLRRKDKKGKYVTASGAQIVIQNRSNGAIVASGLTDGNGNWTGVVPANANYQLTATFDGGRVKSYKNFTISKKGNIINVNNMIMK